MSSSIASSNKMRNISVALLLATFTLAISFVLYIGGVGVLPPGELRTLARAIVENAYNPLNKTLTAYSMNAVSAVIWDYRGIDTVLETAVMVAAITGVTALLKRDLREVPTRSLPVSVALATSMKIVVLFALLVSASLAVHGHLSPGGGFQAGAVIAAAVALAVATYSMGYLNSVGFRSEALLKTRFIALTIILMLMLSPALVMLATGERAYILQNQVKGDSDFAMPSRFLDTPLGGSIFFFNIAETLAVAAALSYVVMAMAGTRDD